MKLGKTFLQITAFLLPVVLGAHWWQRKAILIITAVMGARLGAIPGPLRPDKAGLTGWATSSARKGRIICSHRRRLLT